MRSVLLCVVSAGWLLPLYAGYHTYARYLELEVFPKVLSQTPPMNSFPFLRFSHEMVTVSFVWLGIAILTWSFLLGRRLLGKSEPE